MSKRFENKNTVVKGFIIDKRNGQATPFETVTAYVRATEKAAKMIDVVSLGIAIEDADNFIVVASECINEKSEPIRYSNSGIIGRAYMVYDVKDSALALCEQMQTPHSVREVKFYTFECGAFLRETISEATAEEYAHYEYHAETVFDETPLNLTKVDARAFMVDSAQRLTGFECLYVADIQKHEIKRYAVIADEELAKCIVEKAEK